MLFHDVMRNLEDSDLKILASYFEGAKVSSKKDDKGKKIEETKGEFITRFVQILILTATSNKEDDNWSMIHDVLSKIPNDDIKILIAFFLGVKSSGDKETKKEMIGGLITFIHDVLNYKAQKEKGVQC